MMIMPLFAVIAIVVVFAKLPWSPSRVAGLTLMILGFTVLTIARMNLGNSFSITPQATELITSGVYSRIRNPIYIFSAIGLAGLFLFVDKPILLLLLLPVVAVQMWRARAESRVLEARFGEEYRQYKARTWV